MSKIQYCSFCDSHKNSVSKLIVGESVAICNVCIDRCNTLIEETKSEEIPNLDKCVDAYDVKKFLDGIIVGQTDAKIVLSVAISNHYKRINNKSKKNNIQKGNVLLIGPTGSGKTLLAKSIAKFMKVPFVVADATTLTEAGYVGDDVESMLSTLLAVADNDIELAEKGIIFIDEIDKISKKSESSSIIRDVSGEGVQQALLKIIEGTVCRVNISGKRKHPQGDFVEMDTKDILFIVGGSFVGLENIIDNRKNGSSMGFLTNQLPTKSESLYAAIPDDMVKFGLIPEFVGRFTSIAMLKELKLDELIEVLSKIKNNFISQYEYLFSLDEITLTFTDEAKKQIAQNCLDLKTGTRGLHNELERVLMPHMFHIQKYRNMNVKNINITSELVNNPKGL